MVFGESCNGVGHADDAEREVVHDSGVLEGGIGSVVEHVFEPVGTVGYLLADPVGCCWVGASAPVGAETEDVAPEGVFFGLIGDHEAYVDDSVAWRDGRRGRVGNRLVETALNEDDEVAFRISNGELSVLEGLLGPNVFGFEIALELLGVAGGECDCSETGVGIRRRCSGDDLDPLGVIDGIEPHAVGLLTLEAEGVAVELLGGCGISGVEAGESDSGDWWARGLLSKCRGCEEKGEQQKSSRGIHGTNCKGRRWFGQTT